MIDPETRDVMRRLPDRTAELSAGLKAAKAILASLGGHYPDALEAGLQLRSLYFPGGRESTVVGLADVLDVSPAVAAATYRGCALSPDRDERLAAAEWLPALKARDAAAAAEIYNLLIHDQDQEIALRAQQTMNPQRFA